MYIYKLLFSSGDFYIGRTSMTLESRLNSHRSRLKNNTHYNYRMQELFNKLNMLPSIELVETCDPNNINNREIFWIKTLDATIKGLNITKGGEGPAVGEDNPNAKYSLDDYTAIVVFLALTDMTTKEISHELNVSVKTVEHIRFGESHQYLRLVVPKEYDLMISKKGTSKPFTRSYTYPDLVSPEGKVHRVTNIKQFAAQHGLDNSNISKLMRGIAKSHKGWKLCPCQ